MVIACKDVAEFSRFLSLSSRSAVLVTTSPSYHLDIPSMLSIGINAKLSRIRVASIPGLLLMGKITCKSETRQEVELSVVDTTVVVLFALIYSLLLAY